MKKDNTPKNKATFSAGEVAVLIEDLRSQFRIFGEKLQGLEDKFNGRFDTLEDKFNGRFDTLFGELGRQKEDIFVIKTDLRIIKNDIVEIKEFLKTHEKRITHLETVK